MSDNDIQAYLYQGQYRCYDVEDVREEAYTPMRRVIFEEPYPSSVPLSLLGIGRVESRLLQKIGIPSKTWPNLFLKTYECRPLRFDKISDMAVICMPSGRIHRETSEAYRCEAFEALHVLQVPLKDLSIAEDDEVALENNPMRHLLHPKEVIRHRSSDFRLFDAEEDALAHQQELFERGVKNLLACICPSITGVVDDMSLEDILNNPPLKQTLTEVSQTLQSLTSDEG